MAYLNSDLTFFLTWLLKTDVFHFYIIKKHKQLILIYIYVTNAPGRINIR